MFDENTWFYIERKKTNQSLSSLGKKKIKENNVLLVKFNNIGILSEKKFIDKSKMNKLKFAENVTQKEFKKNNFLFNIFTSMREKMNSLKEEINMCKLLLTQLISTFIILCTRFVLSFFTSRS